MKKNKARYYRFSRYLKERFHCIVYKVSVDAGFSCPNRDGTISEDGCIYCNNRAFSFNTRSDSMLKPLKTQIEEGLQYGRKRYNAQKFILYFQAHTNTYAAIETLREKYDVIRNFENIVGLSIGTRPDCINNEILDLIESYSDTYEVWVEYGLQSIHDNSLETINRGHLYDAFIKALELTRNRDIKVCVHVIIGLPGEKKEDILETAEALGHLKIDAVKMHPLHVIRNTKLDQMYNEKIYTPLLMDEYCGIIGEFLQYLSPQTIIQRITADCPRDMLVAPLWILDKGRVLQTIDRELEKKDIYQGQKHLT